MSIVRYLIDKGTSGLCRMKRNRRVRVRGLEESIRVNLGCGLAVAPGWLNVDGSLNALIAGWPNLMLKAAYRCSGSNQYYSLPQYLEILSRNRFVHHNLEFGIPLHDQSVDVLYSSHFLEHLTHSTGTYLLKESYRVLKPGGLVRISVPDLKFAIELYARGEKDRMLNNYFFVDQDGSYFARHKFMYDFALLKGALEGFGFKQVRQCTYQQGECPDLTVLDNRPEDSLYVEARK